MDREKEQGYLERQAKTMDIIDTYVADSAPSWLEISDGCRARILASEVTRSVFVCFFLGGGGWGSSSLSI